MQTTPHFTKGAPVQGTTCPSLCKSSQQPQMQQLTEDMEGESGRGGGFPIYSPGNDGDEAEGKREDTS